MKKNCEHKNPLQRDGWNQTQRYRSELEPSFAPIDNRTTEDFLQYAFRYAKHLKFFNIDNVEEGNWELFFDKINSQSLDQIEAHSKNDPHFTLFLCFLKLFNFAQDQLNGLTEKHLDFYYQQVLQLKEKPESPDRVHLLFELAKNANEQMIKAGTRFKAGKDATGAPLEYVAEEDTLINKTSVELLRTIRRENDFIHFAAVSNSGDGMGEEPIEDGSAWDAFGHSDLPIAAPGFALASPILELSEGNRTVTIFFNLTSTENLARFSSKIRDGFEVFASGEEDWLGPFDLESTSSLTAVGSSSSNFLLKLIFKIPADSDPVVAFNAEVLTGEFNTTSPIIRLNLKDNGLYKVLENNTLTKVQIEVEVNGMKELILENDQGKLDASKPFTPFGATPRKGANFYIGSQEAFTKTLKSFNINFRWQNLPSNFSGYYQGFSNQLSNAQNNSFTGTLQILDGKNWKDQTFENQLFNNSLSNPAKSISIDFLNNDATDEAELQEGKQWSKRSLNSKQRYLQSQVKRYGRGARVRFFEDGLERKRNRKRRQRHYFQKRVKQKNKVAKPTKSPLRLSSKQKDGFVRLALGQHFGHAEYSTLYALAIAKKVNPPVTYKDGLATTVDPDTIHIPNDPYTPTLEYATLDYTAITNEVRMSSSNNNQDRFDNREVQFFHLHPFGYTEEHPYLKQSLPFAHNNQITIFPKQQNEGEFFIGLKNIEPNQSLSLLLELDEGSANPELDRQEVEWSVLSHNHWNKLDDEHLLADQTNQLLTSGIVKLILPKIATDDNTILDENYFWLRLTVKEKTDAVAKFLGVHTQALKAVFQNNGNAADHLENTLPAETISKMAQRLSSVKKITQPYDSFGGMIKENSTQYYTRVSERLRHKNRAISIWDYEHLVLENFPEIYKVKCLNHTNATNEFAPGNVYLIVIPNLKDRNTANILKPKVSTNTLASIEVFLNKKNSMFTTTVVQNPDYEEVALEFKVAFHASLEFGFYKKQLNEDLKKFLTPWAFEEGRDIHFGGKIHKSVIINFIDGLEYVDFVTDFNMFHLDENGVRSTKKEVVETSSSRAILVSTENHVIDQAYADVACGNS